MSSPPRPIIGIIGGTGFALPFADSKQRVKLRTQYGYPSDEVVVAHLEGVPIAYLNRHGRDHRIPPHLIPYRANIAALQQLGVRYVFGSCLAGSLRKTIPPESLVVMDQFVNLTSGRDEHPRSKDGFVHLSMDDPYCHHLRKLLANSARMVGEKVLRKATVVVINGPRFATFAESRFYMRQGWDIINMTQYPECYAAKEMGICYAAIAAITDYDAGVRCGPTMNPRYRRAVEVIIYSAIRKMQRVLKQAISLCAISRDCSCASDLVRGHDIHK